MCEISSTSRWGRRQGAEVTPMKRVFLLVLAFAALVAPQAQAAPGVQYGLTDDAWLQQGPGSLQSRLAQLDKLGVRVVRFTVRWDAVAPSKPAVPTNPADPAYDWTATDAVLNGLRAHGIQPIVQLLGPPAGATGGKPSNYAPATPATFGAFATAAGRHYRWVKRWLIWNEPNQVRWLRPTSAAIYTARLL